jgi:hypothetical protein
MIMTSDSLLRIVREREERETCSNITHYTTLLPVSATGVGRDLLGPMHVLKDDLRDLQEGLQLCNKTLDARILPFSSVAMDLPFVFQQSFVRAPIDADGFAPASLINKSAQRRWELWLEGHDPYHVASEWLWAEGASEGWGGMYGSMAHEMGEEGEEDEGWNEGGGAEEGMESEAAGGAGHPAAAVQDEEEEEDAAAAVLEPEEILREVTDAWTLSPDVRMRLYQYLEQRGRQRAQREVENIVRRYREKQQEFKAIKARSNTITHPWNTCLPCNPH